jgi:quercetin dioxygenase-like cupin family protein
MALKRIGRIISPSHRRKEHTMHRMPLDLAAALVRRRRTLPRRAAGLALLALLTIGGGYVGAVLPARGQAGPQTVMQETFDATGLPAGPARGDARRTIIPAGFRLKHVHGGPTYVHVVAGSLEIIAADGSSTTYDAGAFFWEPAGRIHTVFTAAGAQIFVLHILPPGADATIPVP